MNFFLIFLLIFAVSLSIIFFFINAADLEPTIEKTYIFSKEFDEKLISLGCKQQFLRNLNKHCVKNHLVLSEEINCLKEQIWFDFISNGFWWRDSPEGYDYWQKIALS